MSTCGPEGGRVGSVGTRAWILLMLGRDDQDPLFLQAKEAQESALGGFVQRPPPGQAPTEHRLLI
jgi:hypothetical protein